jgi:hypothetical protein
MPIPSVCGENKGKKPSSLIRVRLKTGVSVSDIRTPEGYWYGYHADIYKYHKTQ